MAIATVLVGVDLSEGSDLALERAAAIATLHAAELVLVHAQADDAPLDGTSNEMLDQLGEVSAAMRVAEARGLAERLTQLTARGLRARLVTRVGPPAEVLTACAIEENADLIAVGSHGITGIHRFLIGSVAASTIREATCDVLVCRGPVTRAAFARPLVATDFSPAAAKALTHAARRTAPAAAIEIIHAWQLPAGSWGATLLGQARFPWSTVRDAVLDSAKAQAARAEQEAASLGHPVHVALVQGPPTSVITHAAESGGHDLIAVGAHGKRGVRRLLLGSVAESTVRHAPCSVLVVHGLAHA
jgi:nucleotide-binding universal stress UspA family protein